MHFLGDHGADPQQAAEPGGGSPTRYAPDGGERNPGDTVFQEGLPPAGGCEFSSSAIAFSMRFSRTLDC